MAVERQEQAASLAHLLFHGLGRIDEGNAPGFAEPPQLNAGIAAIVVVGGDAQRLEIAAKHRRVELGFLRQVEHDERDALRVQSLVDGPDRLARARRRIAPPIGMQALLDHLPTLRKLVHRRPEPAEQAMLVQRRLHHDVDVGVGLENLLDRREQAHLRVDERVVRQDPQRVDEVVPGAARGVSKGLRLPRRFVPVPGLPQCFGRGDCVVGREAPDDEVRIERGNLTGGENHVAQ
ncbi:MAG: hypothetical protein A3I61_19855 [Acidobacteria bacterium RIFCSPLOWO2_02_FULL_68_18]|nr:MAG: hypothetical protein A3I61_19855 [Acidobacteria bacterium RIFCSPLOWO2_02_FULL_68_18]